MGYSFWNRSVHICLECRIILVLTKKITIEKVKKQHCQTRRHIFIPIKRFSKDILSLTPMTTWNEMKDTHTQFLPSEGDNQKSNTYFIINMVCKIFLTKELKEIQWSKDLQSFRAAELTGCFGFHAWSWIICGISTRLFLQMLKTLFFFKISEQRNIINLHIITAFG